MFYLSDEMLVEVYMKAMLLANDKDLLGMLKDEIIRRGIDVFKVIS